MNEVKLKLNEQGRGSFVIEDNAERLAEMEIALAGGNLIVYHTEVSLEVRGQGISSLLLDAMVEYVKAHQLKVIALCPFVRAQFLKYPEKYDAVWNRDWKKH